jgi:hypothetical protein
MNSTGRERWHFSAAYEPLASYLSVFASSASQLLGIEQGKRPKQLHSSTAMKRHGDAPPSLINRGRMIIFTRALEILSQSTRHLQPAMDFLINAP